MPARKRYRVFLRLLAVSMARNETERNVCQSTCRYRRQFRNHGACSPASESPVNQEFLRFDLRKPFFAQLELPPECPLRCKIASGPKPGVRSMKAIRMH